MTCETQVLPTASSLRPKEVSGMVPGAAKVFATEPLGSVSAHPSGLSWKRSLEGCSLQRSGPKVGHRYAKRGN